MAKGRIILPAISSSMLGCLLAGVVVVDKQEIQLGAMDLYAPVYCG